MLTVVGFFNSFKCLNSTRHSLHVLSYTFKTDLPMEENGRPEDRTKKKYHVIRITSKYKQREPTSDVFP